jgi:hypothetical protein
MTTDDGDRYKKIMLQIHHPLSFDPYILTHTKKGAEAPFLYQF